MFIYHLHTLKTALFLQKAHRICCTGTFLAGEFRSFSSNLFCSEELEAGDPAILEDDLLGREERHKFTLLLQKQEGFSINNLNKRFTVLNASRFYSQLLL
jgi:hypothetical protein